MTFTEISKLIMNGERLFNLPLRVCFYARVSTDSDVQLNSLDNQREFYENYIKSKPNWEFVNGYIDEGISGVRVDKRDGFKKMVRDAKEGKFDLIITKEVSRFARDLEDSIHYIRELKTANVGIFFENQNLNTFDTNSELILNIMFNLAQDESRKLSSRVKFGHKEAISKGHVLGSSNITGYKKDNCKLVIDENEAKFIRKLFELYATGEYGFYKLSKTLGSLGYFNKKGNFYDKDTLKSMIQNPKYKGYYRGKTTETLDYRTKKRKKVEEENQIIYKCDDGVIPAIVSEELWDKANEFLKSRIKKDMKSNYYTGGLKYPFSSKIYCKEDNTSYQRSHSSKSKNRPTWSCSKYLQYRLDACASPIIAESDLYNILGLIFNRIIPDENKIINNLMEIYKNTQNNNQYNKDLNIIDDNIKKIENKKMFVLDLVYNGEMKKEQLQVQYDKIENELNILKKQKKDILNQIEIMNNKSYYFDKLKNAIKEEINGGALDDFIRMFVDEIIVSKIDNDRYNIKLDIYLNLSGIERYHTKGSRHIKKVGDSDVLYMKNIKYITTEKKRKSDKPNKFTYNVYVESL